MTNLLALILSFVAQTSASQFPFAFWKNGSTCATGKTGSLGDVTISGTTTLTPGTSYDYNSLTINVGGVLNISAGSSWVQIYTCTTLVNNGTVQGTSGEHTGGTFTSSAATSESLSYTITQALGGDGGDDGVGSGTNTLNDFGNGGGGGGQGFATSPITGAGGDGGASSSGVTAFGATVYSQPGSPGHDEASSFLGVEGGGGSGGSRGRHGQGIYMYVGTAYSGNGSVNVSGGNGGSAGKGGDATGKIFDIGGGGGGGAAGGSGGKILVRYGTNTSTVTYTISGGSGGAGGIGGFATGVFDGAPGTDGSSGSTGSTSVIAH